MERSAQLGLGEGPFKSGSNIPTPRYHQYRVTHAGSHSRTYVRFLSQRYSRQLRVSCYLMFRGAVTQKYICVPRFGARFGHLSGNLKTNICFWDRIHIRIKGQNFNFYLETYAATTHRYHIYLIRLRILHSTLY